MCLDSAGGSGVLPGFQKTPPYVTRARAEFEFTAFAQPNVLEAPMPFKWVFFTVEQADQHIVLAGAHYSRSYVARSGELT